MENIQHNNITIRRAEAGDEAEISAVLFDAFIGYKYLYTEKAFNATILGVDKIKERISNRVMWVALFNGTIGGTLSFAQEDDAFYIRSVAVSPMVQRKGLGKALMMHAEKEAVKTGIQKLKLTTTPFLFEAIALYQDLEFTECGSEDLFGTQLIKMEKALQTDFNDYSTNDVTHATQYSHR